MQKPAITLKTLMNERGTVLVLTVFFVILFMILTMGMVEFGRMLVYKEKLQTATDSASLAATTTGIHRWVKVKVTTDRGDHTVCRSCGEDTCCTCEDCGEVTRTTPYLEEKDLIENGEWRDWCYPPCDCTDTPDCWFEILDRYVTYDITSRQQPVTATDVANFRDEMTKTVRDVLVALPLKDKNRGEDYSRMMKNFVSNKSLETISKYLGNRDAFAWNGAFTYYATEYYQREEGDCSEYDNSRCTYGYKIYPYVKDRKAWVDQVIAKINSYSSLQYRYLYSSPIERTVEDYADYYFLANAPDTAEIKAVKVHGQRADPYYPSVTVYARGYVLPLLAQTVERITNGAGIMDTLGTFKPIPVDICSQGTTFYRDPSTQAGEYTGSLKGIGKWIRKPEESCWKDYNL